jgi:two-component system heavy metal sensor histidine kinase CusS
MKAFSLTARLSLLFALGAAVVLLGLGWVVHRAVDGHFHEMDRHEMAGKLSLLRSLFRQSGDRALLAARMQDALVGHHHLAVTVRAPGGEVWFRYGQAELPPDLPAGEGMWSDGRQEHRLLAEPLADARGVVHVAVVALNISHHRQFLEAFHHTLGAVVTLAALLTAALGWVATRTGLSPLREATRLAARLSARSLGERLPLGGQPAEIAALSESFNAMLARLEESFGRLSEFSSDIAHELRTPLTNLMTQLQVALGRTRSEAEYREALASGLEEVERLARMVGDMLFLAQADNRLITPREEAVDLALEARRVAEFYEALAAEAGVVVTVAGEARVRGDRLMLQRALSNLISNALRHTPSGGAVAVRMGQEGQGAWLAVENPGEIPPERLPRLFDRFYTGDPARRASGEGAGLGLAITRSIIEAHGGAISAVSEGGVARFEMRLR